jgi:membrane protease YdiL (CAAX protease family)
MGLPVATPDKLLPNWLVWIVLSFALAFPSVMGWLDYGITSGQQPGPNAVTQLAYVLGKLIQFGLPVAFVTLATRRLPLPSRPNPRGIRLGLAFGALVALGTILLYAVFLRDTSVFRDSPVRIRAKLSEFGLNSPLGFVLFAVGVTVPHSLLEEYYWRWFVFGELRRRISRSVAIALSSAAFGVFHIFPLNAYLPDHFFTAVLPFAGCVAVGGAVWAWLYERTGSVYAPWLSHLLVDASLFVVGYDLFFVRGATAV